ncbi:hypothetical protein CkaCkLH20_09410 [Colletotrichum karsti]|uniref:Uncharacterized protein n=1 Tax=Colletotrichum karsti TaxID=1095194 RepID=A0A9P6HZY2_9PEZI|nr:uncharacterized protein CkaCkLH20_09410 [Colletotrichum karsti]KAF9873247.1 hypothetical protein CkaCkLH20_09410 [Colletotrichum karsti]
MNGTLPQAKRSYSGPAGERDDTDADAGQELRNRTNNVHGGNRPGSKCGNQRVAAPEGPLGQAGEADERLCSFQSAAMVVPNWLRIIFLVLTFASFVPQLHRLWARRDSTGISHYYVLASLIVATELFAISFFLVVNNRFEGSDFFVHSPPNAGDIINLAQLALVWVLWLNIFVTCLVYPSGSHISPRPRTTLSIYISFLLISLVPLAVDLLANDPLEKDHRWPMAVFGYVHTSLINPLIPLVGVAALYFQAREILAQPPGSGPAALSLISLAAQAAVFALLAVAWVGRVVFPWDTIGGPVDWGVVKVWYQYAGFVAVDSFISAVTQAIILWLAVHYGLDGKSAGEAEPLLAN